MNKLIVTLLVVIIGLLIAILLLNTNSINFFSFDGSINGNEKGHSLAPSMQKITWYQIIIPLKNETMGFLYIKTEDGTIDSTRISTIKTTAVTSLLREKNVMYDLSKKRLVITKENLENDSIIVNQ